MPDELTACCVHIANLFDCGSVGIESAQGIPVSGWAADDGRGQVCHWSVLRALAVAPLASGDHPAAIGCIRLGIGFARGDPQTSAPDAHISLFCRSEERRVGKERVSTCSTRAWPEN